METQEKWLRWAIDLQQLAQAGLYYGHDDFDKERYEKYGRSQRKSWRTRRRSRWLKFEICFATKWDTKRPSWRRAPLSLTATKFY